MKKDRAWWGRRFVLVLGALAIAFSGCAGAYRDAPIMIEDLILEEIAIVWTMDGTVHRGMIEATGDRGVLLVNPDGGREWIALGEIRTLKYAVHDSKSLSRTVKIVLGISIAYGVLAVIASQIQFGPIGGR